MIWSWSVIGTNIDFNHNKIHEGTHYFYSRTTTLGNGATGNWVLTSATKDLHFVYSIDSDFAGFTFATYEDITADADGTLLEINNNNRRKGDNSSAVLRYNPSNIVTTNKRVMRDANKGTAINPAKSSAGSIVRSDEVVLYAGKKYLLRITNKATSDNPINVSMTWYEV